MQIRKKWYSVLMFLVWSTTWHKQICSISLLRRARKWKKCFFFFRIKLPCAYSVNIFNILITLCVQILNFVIIINVVLFNLLTLQNVRCSIIPRDQLHIVLILDVKLWTGPTPPPPSPQKSGNQDFDFRWFGIEDILHGQFECISFLDWCMTKEQSRW